MEFTWHELKARKNIRKHGVPFTVAEAVFADPFAVTTFDRVVGHEERWRTIGCIVQGRSFKLIVVIHTYPAGDDVDCIHIVSIWEASNHERRDYETQVLRQYRP